MKNKLPEENFYLTNSILAYSLWSLIALALVLVLSLEWADEPVSKEPAGRVIWTK